MDEFMPHGYCLQWNSSLVALFVVGNFMVAMSYFSIPLNLWILIRRREDLMFRGIYALFAIFIVSCGLSHVVKVWTIWNPQYWLEASIDLATGLVSVVAAVALWRLLPNALTVPNATISMLQTLFDVMPELGWTAVADGTVDFYNKGWYEFTGTTTEEMKGRGWESVCDSEYLPEVKTSWLKSINTGVPFEMEFPMQRHDGERRWFLTRISPIRNDSGKVIRWVGINTDINDKRQAEANLKQRQKELETLQESLEARVSERTEQLEELNNRNVEISNNLARSNRDLEHFAYLASHDLQEPLRTVISFCGLLNKKTAGTLDADSQKYLRVVTESTERMQQLIKDLLLYARLDNEGKPLRKTELQEPIAQSLDALKVAISDSGAEITCDPMPLVLGDSTQLSLLFQNLIGNAIKFRGSEPPKIHIAAEKKDEQWELTVSDNGIGINMEYADRIFVIFQRLHSRSKYDGTGIGLAVCKRIVERHGGLICIESSPGSGATFKFTLLPIKEEAVA